jgi:hypothetical protein
MSDEGVRACSLAARGLWFDLLCIAGTNKDKEYGFVMVGGRAPSVEQIARRVGATVEEVEILVRELEDARVFSRDRRGIIYCRRMVRAEKSRGNGRLGGNPNLVRQKENPEQVKPEPKAPIPEPEPEPIPVVRKRRRSPAAIDQLSLVPTVQTTAMQEQGRSGKKGTLLPDGWSPSPELIRYGENLGLTHQQIEDLAENMRLWAKANGHLAKARKLDWEATFKSFMRRERNDHKHSGWKRERRDGFAQVREYLESIDDDESSAGIERFPALPAPRD